jgi:CBS domain-containing protein
MELKEQTIANEIMSNEVMTCTVNTTVEDALKMMINSRITGMPVVDDQGIMIGILSETNMVRLFQKADKIDHEFFSQPITFTKQFTTIQETVPLQEVLEVMVSSKSRRLAVLDVNGKLVGIVSKRDLMKVFYYRAKLL